MKQSRKKGSKLYEAVRKILIAVIVIAAAFSESSDSAAVILGLAVFALICVSIYNYYAPNLGAKNGAGPRTTWSRAVVKKKNPLAGLAKAGGDAAEEPLHCAHSRGKEKYYEQLDSFLANGLIDRKEYQQLKERYSRLEIEDDYH